MTDIKKELDDEAKRNAKSILDGELDKGDISDTIEVVLSGGFRLNVQ